MDRPTCETCPFWDGPDEVGTGICRRHAPTPAKRSTEQDKSEQDKSERFPVWPRTVEDEWCGEHPDFPAWIASAKPG
jgi:hypothetical protein